MRESPVRREIVAQHDEMRELVRMVEDLAQRFERAVGDDPSLGSELHARGLELYEKFGAHLDREQELLEPLLRSSGAVGEKLARRLVNEHHEQRELLKYLLRRLSQYPPTVLIARELQHFAGFLRFEMDQEETTLLTPSVLGE